MTTEEKKELQAVHEGWVHVFMPECEPESATEEGYENPDVEQSKKKVCSVSTLTWHSCELIHHKCKVCIETFHSVGVCNKHQYACGKELYQIIII